jgi:hypothetical protein
MVCGVPDGYRGEWVSPLRDDGYQVFSAPGVVLGRGNAEEAIALVVANLPSPCGPAVRGTPTTWLVLEPKRPAKISEMAVDVWCTNTSQFTAAGCLRRLLSRI